MEFFYNMELEASTPPFNGQALDKYISDKVVPIILLDALAKKYDARMLQCAAAQAFTKSMTKWPRSITTNNLETLVHSHYPFCTGTMCDMGEAIVTFLLKSPGQFLKSGHGTKILDLVKEYGNFGADLYVLGIRSGKLVTA